MKQFLKSFLTAFFCVLSTIWAIHNYNQYTEALDSAEKQVRISKAYAEYYPILKAQIADMTQSR